MTAPEPSTGETAPLAGKTALVTGAATGIGKAIATALAAHGGLREADRRRRPW
jgi:3-oxoacyl-[acyl-carrier protein] reductase